MCVLKGFRGAEWSEKALVWLVICNSFNVAVRIANSSRYIEQHLAAKLDKEKLEKLTVEKTKYMGKCLETPQKCDKTLQKHLHQTISSTNHVSALVSGKARLGLLLEAFACCNGDLAACCKGDLARQLRCFGEAAGWGLAWVTVKCMVRSSE